MREKLNSNPRAQVLMVGVLLVLGAFLLMSKMGGGEESEEVPTTEAIVSVAGTGVTGTATGATSGEAVEGAIENAENASAEATPSTVPGASTLGASIEPPPLPHAVSAAYKANKTVALLIVHNGGIDDTFTTAATAGIASDPQVALFIVPASQIYRYAAITLGVEVSRVPALVVMRPRKLSDGTPQATVDYGLQTAQDVELAVHDAAYDPG
jgi:hypothetical protein